jgi:pimeloyl-ACP methyl ester carboxylesterase
MDNKYAAPGELVDIGGYRLHLNSSGEGSPVVILESGTGGSCLDWSLIQPEVAKITRVCSYDRAGLGWSDTAPSDSPRSAQVIVDELHTLLSIARVPAPYILVGHSLGGLTARLYTDCYPKQVAGIVMVDATHEDELSPRFPWEYVRGYDQYLQTMRTFAKLAPLGFLKFLMKVNLLGPASVLFARLPTEVRPVYQSFFMAPRTLKTLVNEMDSMLLSYTQVRKVGIRPNLLAGRPLVVIKHGIHDRLSRRPSKSLLETYTRAYDDVQAELADLSSNSRLITAEKSGHNIYLEQPEVVIGAISEVVNQLRTSPVGGPAK